MARVARLVSTFWIIPAATQPRVEMLDCVNYAAPNRVFIKHDYLPASPSDANCRAAV